MSVRVLTVVLSVLAVVLVTSATGLVPEARATLDIPAPAHALAQDSDSRQDPEESRGTSGSSESSESPESSGEGPALDPQTEAEAEKNRSKIVVGVIAAVLLGIVVWGRYLRSKKAKGG
ncbi:hypothetical protein [Saccharomonospora xinjiangensis]|uniref:Uncharacterized protein n=1 Tax=Saccharomonospora xinjiangensis XJ-54 TaxID=882086 RepID=I0V0M7_9PSEU|nr:hypothetical protein [Saccharomonospora xinjiangensis]EID53680.1 hypothetical protein SacxiDRAFT_1429 [Saccharomonospora xinjiangensis XJ-54]